MAPRKRADCQICKKTESKYACPACEVLYCSVVCYKEHKTSSCATRTQAESPAPTSNIAPAHSVDVCEQRTPERDLEEESQATSVEAGSLEVSPESRTEGKDETQRVANESHNSETAEEAPPPTPQQPLRKLSSLKWPYVQDEPVYEDPLKRDDPKQLTLAQYEAIARSPAVRQVLSSHARLPNLLRSLDQLRGSEREEALQRVLGVAPSQSSGFTLAGLLSPSESSYSPASSMQGSGVFRRGGARSARPAAADIRVDEEDMRTLRAFAEAVEAAVRGASGRSDLLGLDWEA